MAEGVHCRTVRTRLPLVSWLGRAGEALQAVELARLIAIVAHVGSQFLELSCGAQFVYVSALQFVYDLDNMQIEHRTPVQMNGMFLCLELLLFVPQNHVS